MVKTDAFRATAVTRDANLSMRVSARAIEERVSTGSRLVVYPVYPSRNDAALATWAPGGDVGRPRPDSIPFDPSLNNLSRHAPYGFTSTVSHSSVPPFRV